MMVRQLTRAGIAVETQAENALYINLDATLGQFGEYSYALSLEFLQLVLLFRDPSMVTWGTTWSLGQVGTLSSQSVDELNTLIARGVSSFIEDYLSVNRSSSPVTSVD